MKLVCISDTHGAHNMIPIPDGDVFIHAGDFTGMGREEEVKSFAEFLKRLPHKHKIVIAGNHDVTFARMPDLARYWLGVGINCTYLENSGVEIDGVKFWGSPHHSFFDDSGTWVFGVKAGKEAEEVWSKIPEDTDVLITHGMPLGILDQSANGKQTGDAELLKVVEKIKPKIHLFGHIHEQGGKTKKADTEFFNIACLNEHYQLMRGTIVLELNKTL